MPNKRAPNGAYPCTAVGQLPSPGTHAGLNSSSLCRTPVTKSNRPHKHKQAQMLWGALR